MKMGLIKWTFQLTGPVASILGIGGHDLQILGWRSQNIIISYNVQEYEIKHVMLYGYLYSASRRRLFRGALQSGDYSISKIE